MKTNAVTALAPDLSSPVDSALQPSGEGAEILINTMGSLSGIFTSLAVTGFAEALANTVPLFSPDGENYFLSRIPDIYSSHGERVARATLDSVEIVSDGQRKFLAWEAKFISSALEYIANPVRQ